VNHVDGKGSPSVNYCDDSANYGDRVLDLINPLKQTHAITLSAEEGAVPEEVTAESTRVDGLKRTSCPCYRPVDSSEACAILNLNAGPQSTDGCAAQRTACHHG
jgi:hypothetical protein